MPIEVWAGYWHWCPSCEMRRFYWHKQHDFAPQHLPEGFRYIETWWAWSYFDPSNSQQFVRYCINCEYLLEQAGLSDEHIDRILHEHRSPNCPSDARITVYPDHAYPDETNMAYPPRDSDGPRSGSDTVVPGEGSPEEEEGEEDPRMVPSDGRGTYHAST